MLRVDKKNLNAYRTSLIPMKAPGISMYAILNAYQTAISVMESLIALMAQMKIPAFVIVSQSFSLVIPSILYMLDYFE